MWVPSGAEAWVAPPIRDTRHTQRHDIAIHSILKEVDDMVGMEEVKEGFARLANYCLEHCERPVGFCRGHLLDQCIANVKRAARLHVAQQ